MSHKKSYSKPALTYQQQLDQLKGRGLCVEDEHKALHLLANLSYYRFSAYLHPLLKLPKIEHKFKIDASFDQAFLLYCFDRDLKRLVFHELEKIEISLRAQITYIYAHDENPFWYLNEDLFVNKLKHSKTIIKIENSFLNSKTDFAIAYRKKYLNQSSPSWMALETCDFGTLSQLYSNLAPGISKRKIANYYGLKDTVLVSWLHTFVVIRNICAHHSRLWNTRLNVKPIIPRKTTHDWIDTAIISNKKSYFVIAMIRYMLFTINPTSTFADKIIDLLKQYPSISPDALGIPENAFEQNFWKNKL